MCIFVCLSDVKTRSLIFFFCLKSKSHSFDWQKNSLSRIKCVEKQTGRYFVFAQNSQLK